MALLDDASVNFALQILDKIYNETNNLKGHIAKVTFLGIVSKYKSELKSDPDNEDNHGNKEKVTPSETAVSSDDFSMDYVNENSEKLTKSKNQNYIEMPKSSRLKKRCFRCHQEGHVQRECPNNEVIFCKFCEKSNHKTEECRYLLRKIGNHNSANRNSNQFYNRRINTNFNQNQRYNNQNRNQFRNNDNRRQRQNHYFNQRNRQTNDHHENSDLRDLKLLMGQILQFQNSINSYYAGLPQLQPQRNFLSQNQNYVMQT